MAHDQLGLSQQRSLVLVYAQLQRSPMYLILGLFFDHRRQA